MLRSFEASSMGGWRPDAATVRRGVEGVLVLLLAAQTARLIWMLATPLEPLGEPVGARVQRPLSPPPDLSALEQFAASATPAIIVAAPPVIEAAPPPIAGFRLHGVRASISGDGGAAIISGPDGVQASYGRGDAVGPGVTLTAIGREAVTLSGAAGSVRLAIGADAATAMAPPPSAAPLVGPSPSAASLGFAVPSAAPASGPPQVGSVPGQATLQPQAPR